MGAEEDRISLQIIESLAKNDRLPRKHADFWNFHSKPSKELGIFSEIFDRFESARSTKIVEWGLCEPDPPDVYVRFENGNCAGVEITELVNEPAIAAQIRKEASYSIESMKFDFDAACMKIAEIVREKAWKVAAVRRNYDELCLLIHTDEPLLSSDQFGSVPKTITSNDREAFDTVLLLFSYEPQKQKCPLITLK